MRLQQAHEFVDLGDDPNVRQVPAGPLVPVEHLPVRWGLLDGSEGSDGLEGEAERRVLLGDQAECRLHLVRVRLLLEVAVAGGALEARRGMAEERLGTITPGAAEIAAEGPDEDLPVTDQLRLTLDAAEDLDQAGPGRVFGVRCSVCGFDRLELCYHRREPPPSTFKACPVTMADSSEAR